MSLVVPACSQAIHATTRHLNVPDRTSGPLKLTYIAVCGFLGAKEDKLTFSDWQLVPAGRHRVRSEDEDKGGPEIGQGSRHRVTGTIQRFPITRFRHRVDPFGWKSH